MKLPSGLPSVNLLYATLNHYREMAAKETNPVIKAQYEKQVETLAARIDVREGKHTITQGRIDSAIAFLQRL